VGRPGKNAATLNRFFEQLGEKRSDNLTTAEHEKLAQVQATNRPLFRTYLLKETLASVLDGRQVNVARRRLTEWIGWAARSKLKPFVKVS
jgi:transposase